jgi:hypothetical protein
MSKTNSKTNARPDARPDAVATLKKLEAKDPGLKRLLQKAHGYAVFPSVGKAGLVVGGGYGRGEVFEKGQFIGYATITQLTLGVQVGGDTFSQVVVFEKPEDLELFKKGKTSFAANASAVLVKAGAASAKNFKKGVAVYVYPDGGMLLELGLGGQRFRFKPAGEEQQQGGGEEEQGGRRQGKAAQGRGQEEGDESEQGEEGEQEEGDEQGSEEGSSGGNRALELAGRAVGGVRRAASKATAMVKRHPVAATMAGVGVAAGLGLLIARAMRTGDDEQGEDEQDAGGEEEEQDEGAQDSAEDTSEDAEDTDDESRDEDADDDSDAEDSADDQADEGEDEQDEGEEDESEDESEDDEEDSGSGSNRGVLSRLLSRGKSRA